jgi:hypothetical protein
MFHGKNEFILATDAVVSEVESVDTDFHRLKKGNRGLRGYTRIFKAKNTGYLIAGELFDTEKMFHGKSEIILATDGHRFSQIKGKETADDTDFTTSEEEKD